MAERQYLFRLQATGGSQVSAEFRRAGGAVEGSVEKAARFADVLNEKFGLVSKAARRTQADIDAYGKSLDRLRARYNPAFAVISRYRAELERIRQAHKVGAISANEMAAAISRERREALASLAALKGREAALRRYGAAAARGAANGGRVSSFGIQNAAYQIGDFAVQVAAGTSATRALAMQLPQLLGGFGAMGAVAGAAAAAVGAIVPVLFDTADAAQAVQKSMDDVDEALRAFREAASIATMPVEEAIAKWGSWADEVQRVAGQLADLERIGLRQKLRNAIEAGFGDLVSRGTDASTAATLDAYERRLGEIDERLSRLRAKGGRATSSIVALERQRADILDRMTELLGDQAEALGLGAIRARQLAAALKDAASEDLETRTEGLKRAVELLDAVDVARLDDDRRTQLETVLRLLRQQAEAEGALEQQAKRTNAAQAAKRQEALGLLKTLENEAGLRAMIRQFGADSVVVERLRVQQAREAFAARVKEMEISDDLKARLLDAWDAARGLATEDMAGAIAAAKDEARQLADEIARAAGNAAALVEQSLSALRESEIRLKYKDDPVAQARELAKARFDARVGDISGFDPILRKSLMQQREAFAANAEAVARNREALSEWSKSQREAAGSAQDLKERATQAYKRLRASVDETAAAELRYAEARKIVADAVRLGGISEEEARQTLELVRQSFEDTTRASEELSRSLKDGLLDALTGARDLGDVFDQLAQQIQRAAWEALLFNEGMFAVSGGGGGLLGGFIDMLTGVLTGGGGTSAAVHHEGGVAGQASVTRTVPSWVFAGAPRYHGGGIAGLRPDEVPAILQRGEVVIPRGARMAAGGAGRVDVRITVDRDGNIVPVIEDVAGRVAAQTTESALDTYDRTILPRRAATANPRRLG